MPLANALLTEDQLGSEEPKHLLAVTMCAGCALLQLTDTIHPDDLFVEYAYFSSHSSPIVKHAAKLVERLIPERGLGSDDLVVEIASNDGYLLQHYLAKGVPVLGIDPAANVVKVAIERGVPSRCEFFTDELASSMVKEGIRARVIHANNVLAHVPDINDFVSGVSTLLAQDGVFVVETPYVRDMVERLEFDTIYHEHVFYYSLHSLEELFGRNGLRIVDVERIPVHGGSLRVFATVSSSDEKPSQSVLELRAEEVEVGVDRPEFYENFAARVGDLLEDLRAFLLERKKKGRTIAGYGAAAKGTVLLNALGLGAETFDFVVDETPYKQGRYVPGARIPIRPPDALLADAPDDVVIFAWNFAPEIISKEAAYRAGGGTFILPLPSPHEVH
jgi:SAM-dependent methyltransferase